MEYVTLGDSGLRVSQLVLGTLTFAGTHGFEAVGSATGAVARRLVDRALDAGVNAFDTANLYSRGDAEAVLGEALAGRRDRALVFTKAGFAMSDDPNDGGASRVHLLDQVDRSLRRLRTDYIDLYYQHRLDKGVPIEETVGAMADAVKAGKVRFLGLSEMSAATVRRAHAVHPISAIQTEYSLFSREPERELLPALRELGIGFVAYSPLSRGLLSGAIHKTADLAATDRRQIFPRFKPENIDRNVALAERVVALAEARRVPPSTFVLAWVLAQGNDIVPIPGTKRRSYLEQNCAAAALTLTHAEIEALDALRLHTSVSGERYGDMSSIDR